jgi:hypothetical protein
MRILNRLVAAGILIVPMALGAAGVAAAGVAAHSSVPVQLGTSGSDGDGFGGVGFGGVGSEGPGSQEAREAGDECGGEYPCENTDICEVEGDGFLEGLLEDFLGIGDDPDDECGGDGTRFTD